jgi:hemin uptake protein HemP
MWLADESGRMGQRGSRHRGSASRLFSIACKTKDGGLKQFPSKTSDGLGPLPTESSRTLGSAACAQPRTSAPRLSSDALFGSAHEIEIEHGGHLYRLRKTQLGKLIMTK